jgi:hypothetical protein
MSNEFGFRSYRQLQRKPRTMWDGFKEGLVRELRKMMNA